jgi:hypothetical protein
VEKRWCESQCESDAILRPFSSILTLYFMFDFEKLELYKKAKAFHAVIITSVLNSGKIDIVTKNQLRF